MPYFIILGKWTEQGIKNVKQSPQRVATAKALIEKTGGKWRGIYYTFGEYDFVALVEQGKASDEDVMSSLLTITGAGAVRTKTLKAFSLPEFRKVLGKVRKS
jgi:uncharacterized protein with GYD domain